MANELSGRDALAELVAFRDRLFAHVSKPMQLPEPGLALDLDSRRGSQARMVTYLHQICLLHRENYGLANQVKHLYLMDAFIALTRVENPIALYAMARSMFELSAFLHEVSKRLCDTVLILTPTNWQPVGEKFFGLMIRARFATTNPEFHALLLTQGVPAARLKPFNITHCVTDLAAEAEHRDAEARYQVLCDFVHHNLGSTTTANSGSGTSDIARSAGGGAIVATGTMTITQYEYPVRGKVAKALDDVAPGFLRDSRACVNWLNLTPGSPFSSELLEHIAGNPLGIDVLRPSRYRP